jgi:hypothetical protein
MKNGRNGHRLLRKKPLDDSHPETADLRVHRWVPVQFWMDTG